MQTQRRSKVLCWGMLEDFLEEELLKLDLENF